MHCVACNRLLSDFEATRKIVRKDNSVEYPDLCNKCYYASGLGEIVKIVEREDLAHNDDIITENYDDLPE